MDLLTGTVQLATRGIRNVIERAVILSERSTLQVPVNAAAGPGEGHRRPSPHRARPDPCALDQTGWRIRGPAGVAALLGLKPTALESRIKKLGLQRSR